MSAFGRERVDKNEVRDRMAADVTLRDEGRKCMEDKEEGGGKSPCLEGKGD